MLNWKILLATFVLTLTAWSGAFAQEAIPTVVSIDGDAQTRAGVELTAGTALTWGDEVIVSDGARVNISDGADFGLIAWGPAVVEIKQTRSKATWLDLIYGRVIAAFKEGSRAAMSTRSSVAGVRGTVVYQEDLPGLLDYTCVCEGKVKHKHRVDPDVTHSTKSTHHDDPIQATMRGYTNSTMQHHNDDNVAAVKALIGK